MTKRSTLPSALQRVKFVAERFQRWQWEKVALEPRY